MTQWALGLSAALALAGWGCSSKCGKYADMEVTCGFMPDDRMERVVAEGFCRASFDEEMRKDDEIGFLADLPLKAECAEKAEGDCASYTACRTAADETIKRTRTAPETDGETRRRSNND